MDLRTKFVFALVAVSLGSMLALGFVGYTRARDMLREQENQKLEGVAESKADDLHKVKQAWLDRVRLIASRTQLRISLDDYRRSHRLEEHDRIAQIIEDVGTSVPSLRSVTVYDGDGHVVATTALDESEGYVDLDMSRLPPAPEDLVMTGLAVGTDGMLEVSFLAKLTRDADIVGAAEVVMSAAELIDVTSNYTGLGETGETLIAYLAGRDSAVIVNPVRHAPGPPLGRRIALDSQSTVTHALMQSGTRPAPATDYRGKDVLAATRLLPEFGWALIVKIDAEEQESGVLELRRDMIRLGLSIGAFAILIGTLLGLQFARPIRHLVDVANRIRAGEIDARANLQSDDEIGMLARTFNQMAEKLIASNPELATRRARGKTDEPPAEPDGSP